MAKARLVTETPDELFDKAEQDVMSIVILQGDTVYPPNRKYGLICFHAAQAVEKYLKGYILNNEKAVEKIHNLEVLINSAMTIDESFKTIRDECLLLNQYVSEIRYANRNPITGSDVCEALKAVKKIGDFMPVKLLRDSLSQKHEYQVVSEIIIAPHKPPNSNGKIEKATDCDIER
jgi:HEPN domain-containing protein